MRIEKRQLKVLFLLKRNYSYGYNVYTPKAGLYNSARMTAKELHENLGYDTSVRIVVDGNSIDKELHDYKPNVCILEAIWVTPSKIKELVKLHPHVKFVVRVHSEVPFLANEGMALTWIKEYVTIHNTTVAFNSSETAIDFDLAVGGSFKYLPNLYEAFEDKILNFEKHKHTINIGCFGAIRPLKNQLMQAFAAIAFGNMLNIHVKFHINSGRIEQSGESVLKNMRALFHNTNHTLVEHTWMDREDFLKVISHMDIGMQLSFTESFNIVTADFISQGVPIIVSDTIEWMPDISKVATDKILSIVNKLNAVEHNPIKYAIAQRKALIKYQAESLDYWKNI